jgi:hypothetical protein
MEMRETENEIIARLEEEVRSEMIARLEQVVREIEPDKFIWSDPGPVSLERALGELGFEWSVLEDIAKEHAHLGIPIREYPKTDLVYARANELHAAVKRKDDEALRERLEHHLHSWVVGACVQEGTWSGENELWLDIQHIPDPVSYYLHETEWREFVADVERAMASPGEQFVGGRFKHIDE